MLNRFNTKFQFLSVYSVILLIQVFTASNNQLFGDEAFYWLESQYLAWSYTELPGWTQWCIALSDWLFPHHQLTVRIPTLIAAWAIPWLGIHISKRLTDQQQSHWQAGLLMLSLPLLLMAGILAIPDIWLIFFALSAALALINAVQLHHKHWFFVLGVILALGVNVHVRFWLIVFFAGLVTLWHFWQQKLIIKKLLAITLPVTLIGFMPIIFFNLMHDFPLLNFQLKDRHPWQYQSDHWRFFIVQILVTTPVVFILCGKTILQSNLEKRAVKLLIHIGLLHWLLYAVLGFFSDNLRFNIHWTLVSYAFILLAAVSGSVVKKMWIKWSILTGLATGVASLILLSYWLHSAQGVSKLNAQLTENSRGWIELAQKTRKLVETLQPNQVVTDHFMTLAELKFYLTENITIQSLQHPLNRKHGREQQLKQMSLIEQNSTEKNLLVVEHTALKLTEQIGFYQTACKSLGGIEIIDTLDHQNGLKLYYFFKTGGNLCQLPPISYHETENGTLKGWVLNQKHNNTTIQVHAIKTVTTPTLKKIPLSQNQLFNNLDADKYELTAYQFNDLPEKDFYQLKLTDNDRISTSERIYR